MCLLATGISVIWLPRGGPECSRRGAGLDRARRAGTWWSQVWDVKIARFVTEYLLPLLTPVYLVDPRAGLAEAAAGAPHVLVVRSPHRVLAWLRQAAHQADGEALARGDPAPDADLPRGLRPGAAGALGSLVQLREVAERALASAGRRRHLVTFR